MAVYARFKSVTLGPGRGLPNQAVIEVTEMQAFRAIMPIGLLHFLFRVAGRDDQGRRI